MDAGPPRAPYWALEMTGRGDILQRGVIHRIAAVAERFPDRNALFAEGRHTTYAELAELAAGIAKEIREQGFADERLIGVLTGDDVRTYASILAILANGSAYVPINNKYPADRNANIVEQAGLRLVLASREHAELEKPGSELAGDTTILRTDRCAAAESGLPAPEADPDDLAYLFFTSGSTGNPKGVPIYHRNLSSFLDVVLAGGDYDFSPEDRFLQMFELTFDLSVMSLFAPLCIGACCYVVPESGILYLNIMEILDRQKVTVALMVPSVLSYLQRYFSEIRLESLRYSLFCGEALPQKLVEGWSACVPNALIRNTYGPTEATIYCMAYDWELVQAREEAENGVVAIGTPVDGMKAYIVDDEGRLLPKGQRGELCLRGDQVTDRYWKNEVITRKAFIELEGLGPESRAYRTGDVCFVNANGNYVFCGRADFQVKIDGHRIELGEIEHHARELTGKGQVAALAIVGPEDNFTLHLFAEKGDTPAEQLSEHLKTKLPPYMVPRKIHLLDELPLNLNGKIDRKALERALR